VSTAAATSAPISYRPLDRTDGADLLAVNRACPITSDFTFRFDREPDFFAWPAQVFESFRYTGIFVGERLVGYGMLGFGTGWTADGWGQWGYAGDVRVLPGFRGQRLALRMFESLVETLAAEVHVGFFIVKRGNRDGERIARQFHSTAFTARPAGTFDVVNLPLVWVGRRSEPQSSRPARVSDIPGIGSLLRRAWKGRLFAPPFSDDELARAWSDGGLDRVLVAERDRRIRGVIAWRDFGDVRRTTVLRYSARSWPLRAAWRLARRSDPTIPTLPAPGEPLRAVTVTHLATLDDDPAVQRALLVAALRAEAGRGTHLVQMGGMRGEGVLRAVQGLLRQRFSSEVWVASRPAWQSTLERAMRRPPFVDLAIV
jgi:hypothetical protein